MMVHQGIDVQNNNLLLTVVLFFFLFLPCHTAYGLSNPIVRCKIDYSAANDYIDAHYRHSDYFATSAAEEPVYNARDGVLLDNPDKQEVLREPRLEQCGFQLCHHPVSGISDWTDLKQIQAHYLPSLRKILETSFGETKLEKVIFWHPMWRGSDLSRSQRTAPPAGLVHIDTDVGAYELTDLMKLIGKNVIGGDDDCDISVMEGQIEDGKRFAIVNAWRNIDSSEPVQQSPLAICLPKYESATVAFPYAQPESHKWYTFPAMTSEEVLLFKQYDRRVDRASDLWHCALTGVGGAPRHSLDLRAFCILSEQVRVDENKDRYSGQRQRARLSLEESGCFCDTQASKRNIS